MGGLGGGTPPTSKKEVKRQVRGEPPNLKKKKLKGGFGGVPPRPKKKEAKRGVRGEPPDLKKKKLKGGLGGGTPRPKIKEAKRGVRGETPRPKKKEAIRGVWGEPFFSNLPFHSFLCLWRMILLVRHVSQNSCFYSCMSRHVTGKFKTGRVHSSI